MLFDPFQPTGIFACSDRFDVDRSSDSKSLHVAAYNSQTPLNSNFAYSEQQHFCTKRVGKRIGRGRQLNKWKFDEHIIGFHPESSHYRREHAPHRLYLPSDVTISKMFNLFIDQKPLKPCSYEYYRKVVDKLNISFTKLGHEKCEGCEIFIQHKHGPGIGDSN